MYICWILTGIKEVECDEKGRREIMFADCILGINRVSELFMTVKVQQQ